jgi:hypothetical protein
MARKMKEKTRLWEEAVTDLTLGTQVFSQAAYYGLRESLHQEGYFVQRDREGMGTEFASIEQTLPKTFLPTLFGDDYDDDEPCGALSSLLVK